MNGDTRTVDALSSLQNMSQVHEFKWALFDINRVLDDIKAIRAPPPNEGFDLHVYPTIGSSADVDAALKTIVGKEKAEMLNKLNMCTGACLMACHVIDVIPGEEPYIHCINNTAICPDVAWWHNS